MESLAQNAAVPNKQGSRPVSIVLNIGQTFGRLTVTGSLIYVEHGKGIRSVYPCRCECGKEKKVFASQLTHGLVSSCGCYKAEKCPWTLRKHGHSGKRIYKTWRDMIARCHSLRCTNYARYGARGIRVCKSWQTYETFEKWALAHGYADDLSIDRINNDGNYSPQNCRWTTKQWQDKNTRRTVTITAFGETKCLKDWWRDIRCKVKTAEGLRRRIHKGMNAEEAITTPSKELVTA